MSEDVPFAPEAHHGPSHYYGDVVRILFVAGAVLLLAAQFMGSPFMTVPAAVITAIILVIAAGLTNPVQLWIQWADVLIATGGLLLFGSMALHRYQTTGDIFGQNFMILILVGVFICALYSSVKTVRGTMMRGAPIIE